MRQIILDTETTGLEVQRGHRVIEIGCVELVQRRRTGREFHTYLNPDREIDEGARAVTGIADEFLLDKPRFAEIAQEFLDFIDGAEIIAHNASFDIGFLDAELARAGIPEPRIGARAQVLDTLVLAREKYPGQPWLWLYTFWYQVPPFSTSDNADALVWGLMMVLTLGLALVPFIPGLRDLPR